MQEAEHSFAAGQRMHAQMAPFTITDEGAALRSSAKVRYLETMLPKLKREGHRILLFSQWTGILDILEYFLTPPPPVGLGLSSVEWCRLDGSTAAVERQRLVDGFQAEDSQTWIFLLSTRAGGMGITLTAADHVIAHDLDFNPQIDRQACDRCHRIGQTRDVTVTKLIARGTVDEKIWEIAERKLKLDDAVLEDGRSARSTQTKELSKRDRQRLMAQIIREELAAKK